MIPAASRAIMNSRQEPADSLDYFPTPPYGARALVEHVLTPEGLLTARGVPLGLYQDCMRCGGEGSEPVATGPCLACGGAGRLPPPVTFWDPACGEGHLAHGLRDYGDVRLSDIHDYATANAALGDFLTGDPLDLCGCDGCDWIVFNPPFGRLPGAGAARVTLFVERALHLVETGFARRGVCCFARLGFDTSDERAALFGRRPETVYAPFMERIALVKGAYDPEAGTATDHAWWVWAWDSALSEFMPPRLKRRIPACRDALFRESDRHVGKGFRDAGPRQGGLDL